MHMWGFALKKKKTLKPRIPLLWTAYGVLTVTRGLFADTDRLKYSGKLVQNVDKRGKTTIPKVIEARTFKHFSAVHPAFHL